MNHKKCNKYGQRCLFYQLTKETEREGKVLFVQRQDNRDTAETCLPETLDTKLNKIYELNNTINIINSSYRVLCL